MQGKPSAHNRTLQSTVTSQGLAVSTAGRLSSTIESKVLPAKSGADPSTASFSSLSSLKLRAMITGPRERFLLSFIVLSVFGVVQLHFIMSHPRHPHYPQPCPPEPGIHWVRDPQSCFHYFICVGGRPIRMPQCPDHTVWSVGARNCVPIHSLWDDCPHLSLPPPPHSLRQPPQPTAFSVTRAARNWTAASDRMDALLDPLHPDQRQRETLLRVLPNHPCVFSGEQTYLPHPGRCHWFYNCSAPVTNEGRAKSDRDGWDGLTEECPYPQLFSLATHTCVHYADVDCGKRGLFLDPCEYRQLHCQTAHRQSYSLRHGSCVGLSDGLQPHPGREWTPRYLLCKDQRALQQLECPQDKPIFSPDTMRCESWMDIPKAHGGMQPSCQGRHDGRYPDETGRCGVFYECADDVIQGRFECPTGTVFHPERQTCRRKNAPGIPPPCSNHSANGRSSLGVSLSLCGHMEDGLYADPYGRCALYYECQQSLLKTYHKCDLGTFDPRTQRCQFSLTHVPAPCGQRPNPCLDTPDGQYADMASNCQASYRCKNNLLVRQRACPPGRVFHQEKGLCQLPNDTPPPCGLAPSCRDKADGRYPSPLKGCQFYYTCRAGHFVSYGQCSVEQGGFYFNALTGRCDFPQNVCAPCGIRTHNCTLS
ncbi:uncharacterized protein [Littorina saxatilis]|uniref:uncharacterized protein n=1 Tax=Littorina saxatilis TaxID=31220 RepID=UPI0038B502DF